MRTANSRLAMWGLAGLLALACSEGNDNNGNDAGQDAAQDGDNGGDEGGQDYELATDEELKAFAGDRTGFVVYVDGGGQIKMRDFRAGSVGTTVLVAGSAHVNPLVSPDGGRIVYSQGSPGGIKRIYVRSIDVDDAVQIAMGDVGYWHVEAGSGDEYIVYCDWSDKNDNGQPGKTYKQKLVTGSTATDGAPVEIHDRAMDAGPNGDLTWLGQVYGQAYTYDVTNQKEYAPTDFVLLDESTADHQTCNGSLAPDSTSRFMVLAIPHDYIRVFEHKTAGDRFAEVARYDLPLGLTEWEFPDWSTHKDYFSAILRGSDLKNRLFLVKHGTGASVPDLVMVADKPEGASYSHLYLE